MKPSSLPRLLPTILIAAMTVVACHGGSSTSTTGTTSTPQGAATGPSNSWTWASGAYVAGAWGSYGALGVGTAATAPGARNSPATWRDSSGMLWLFGGLGYDSTGTGGTLDDLWKFTPSTSTWTWMGGSSSVGDPGAYGTLGTATSTSHPGARVAPAFWTDASGNFWLFGGNGLDGTSSSGLLADLWEYSPATGQWVWVAGSSSINVSSIYGVQGTPSATNAPGSRDAAVTWRDVSGNLWLFGGSGYDVAGTNGSLGDLWKFNVATSQWTWIAGPSLVNIAGQYGVVGTAASTNAPGARYGAVSWTDANGKLWMFGGQGYDSTGSSGSLNDLWTFDPASGQWTWVGGASTVGALGVYGTTGTAAATSVPGARGAATAWTDGNGKFWLFGGLGVDSAGTNGYLDDLWSFDPATGLWTFVHGSNLANIAGTYGTLQSGATGNIPGSRFGAEGWVDSSNALWLFGGQGADASGAVSNLNDVWKYTP